MGALAQLGERLVCNQEVTGSIPVRSTVSHEPIREGRIGSRYFVDVGAPRAPLQTQPLPGSLRLAEDLHALTVRLRVRGEHSRQPELLVVRDDDRPRHP